MPNNESLPMAAIGDYEMVLPFQAVGVKAVVLPPDKRDTFEQVLEKLAAERYAVVFIQEDLFVEFTSVVERINDTCQTSVMPLPGIKGSTGAGMESIRNSVEKAVGMDIFAER